MRHDGILPDLIDIILFVFLQLDQLVAGPEIGQDVIIVEKYKPGDEGYRRDEVFVD